ncbi:MAG: hypothetical protein KIT09_20395 [Bryobacteraceae bacterium]|nr:hypothetical protein [Bryobacteraceae bacterium]
MTRSALSAPALPAIRLGEHEITRLICGSNPFYGYSHFNRLFDQHMGEWMTPDRVLGVLRQCEQNGINTWQLHYSDRSVADVKRYREAGGKMPIVILSDGRMRTDIGEVKVAAALKPIGIVHHGGWTDQKFRAGKMDEVRGFLKAVRDSGVMVGLSMHNPAVMEYVEEKNWDIDFYMTCFYRVTRTRDEIVKELGEAPLGELFLEKDPERMTRVIRQTRKPCLAFKILAAGRRANSPEEVATAFRYAYANIKAGDAVIVGMYPRYRDEVAENAVNVRRALNLLT